MIPKFGDTWEIRDIIGPFDYFLTGARFRDVFKLSLEGLVWYHLGQDIGIMVLLLGIKDREKQKETGGHPSNYISNGVPLGAVKVPFGLPGILCADAFTVGGHAKNNNCHRS